MPELFTGKWRMSLRASQARDADTSRRIQNRTFCEQCQMARANRVSGGIVHAYQKYDPKNLPSPTQAPPDVASAAMEHMLRYGSTRELTAEELANAIKIDQINKNKINIIQNINKKNKNKKRIQSKKQKQ
eukprot:TRINITY_DN34385_c0_g1_i1.p3 TRINITY_DN34385_c0_g1~~TRINITY_DN34385_c0_g1_i1.p3  ORF type:complete len:130 (-),score=9.27 TRINITY_DN34385_c0_g1_i1:3-392(-)